MSAPPASRAARQEQTRAALIATAERMFIENGYHATSLDAIAREAGFTKGAVYANFDAKEDLFLAVYERRSERFAKATLVSIREHGAAEAIHRLSRDTTTRRGRDDGWLAVFFEFWAHVLRNPDLREHFATLRARTREPLLDALVQAVAENGKAAPREPTPYVVAMFALQLGLTLERLTDPAVVPPTLGERLSRLALEHLDPNFMEESDAVGVRAATDR
jgi:AcrR family transcriptional regulator